MSNQGNRGSEPPDFNSLLSQLGQVQQNLREAQQAAAAKVVEGTAGGGAVRVKVTGGLDFQDITIDPSVLDDVEMLQDLVLAAVRDAVEQAHALASSALGGIAGAGGGALDLGGLLGL
ncbi:MAG TPA: YbaB/EbfC family nucleoid-associated protein [Acidimicrobiales bacterium]|nr:YbaB/EbfC family nucleoid-associated protein [Acidimicrobiales bacterium]